MSPAALLAQDLINDIANDGARGRAPDTARFRAALAEIAATPGCQPEDLGSLWHEAIGIGCADFLNALVEIGAPLDYAAPSKKRAPLAYAIDERSALACEILLKAGADPAGPIAEGKTRCVIHALSSKEPELAVLLIRELKDPNWSDRWRVSYLHYAVNYGDEAAVSALLAQGADPMIQADGGLTPLALAAPGQADQPGCAQIIRSFIEARELAASLPGARAHRPASFAL